MRVAERSSTSNVDKYELLGSLDEWKMDDAIVSYQSSCAPMIPSVTALLSKKRARGVGDNGPLSLFFRCLGQEHQSGYASTCTIRFEKFLKMCCRWHPKQLVIFAYTPTPSLALSYSSPSTSISVVMSGKDSDLPQRGKPIKSADGSQLPFADATA